VSERNEKVYAPKANQCLASWIWRKADEDETSERQARAAKAERAARPACENIL